MNCNVDSFKRAKSRLQRVARWSEFLNTNLGINQIVAPPDDVVDTEMLYANTVNCPSPSALIPNNILSMDNMFRNTSFVDNITIGIGGQSAKYAYADATFITATEPGCAIKSTPTDLSHMFENSKGSIAPFMLENNNFSSPNLNCYSMCKNSSTLGGIPIMADNVSHMYDSCNRIVFCHDNTYTWNDASYAFYNCNSSMTNCSIVCNNASHMLDSANIDSLGPAFIHCNDGSYMFANAISESYGIMPEICDCNNADHMFDNFRSQNSVCVAFNNSNVNFSRMFTNNFTTNGDIIVSGISGDCSYMFANMNKANPNDTYVGVDSFGTNASHMFYNTSNVSLTTSMNSAFSDCTDASYAFADATNIHFNNFDAVNVVNASHMFYNSYVRIDDYPDYSSLNNVVDGSYLFANMTFSNEISGAEWLSKFEFGNSITNVSHLFEGTNISNVERLTDSMIDGSYMFANTRNLSEMCHLRKISNASHMFDNAKIDELDFAGDFNNIEDGSYMFANSTWGFLPMDNLYFPNVSNTAYMFYNTNLERVPNVGVCTFNSRLRNASHMFDGATIPDYTEYEGWDPLFNFKFADIEDMSYMFANFNGYDYMRHTPEYGLSFYMGYSTNVYRMFYNANITICRDFIEWEHPLNMANMFENCHYDEYDFEVSFYDDMDMSNMFRGAETGSSPRLHVGSSRNLNMDNMFSDGRLGHILMSCDHDPNNMSEANFNTDNILTNANIDALRFDSANAWCIFSDGCSVDTSDFYIDGLPGITNDNAFYEFANNLANKFQTTNNRTINVMLYTPWGVYKPTTGNYIAPLYNNTGNMLFY